MIGDVVRCSLRVACCLCLQMLQVVVVGVCCGLLVDLVSCCSGVNCVLFADECCSLCCVVGCCLLFVVVV